MTKLWIETHEKFKEYTLPYCDKVLISKNKILDKMTHLSYKDRKTDFRKLTLPKNPKIVLNTDLDNFRQGTRVDTALKLKDLYPEAKFILWGFSKSVEQEYRVFQELIGCEIIITWWPLALGLSGREVDEEWPQLREPTGNEPLISVAWLTYVLREFQAKIKRIELEVKNARNNSKAKITAS